MSGRRNGRATRSGPGAFVVHLSPDCSLDLRHSPAEHCTRTCRAEEAIVREHAAGETADQPADRCPRAGWVSILLSEWLRKQCNHPAQGRTSAARDQRLNEPGRAACRLLPCDVNGRRV